MTSTMDRAREGFARLGFEQAACDRALRSLDTWLTQESLAAYRPQLEKLVADERFDVLFDAFWQTIPFGTGGRRGAVGIGPNRFNPWTLLTSVQGHAEMLAERYADEDGDVTVVLAYDVRVFRDIKGVYDQALPNPLIGMSSADFARAAAGVYAANGIQVLIIDPALETYMSTPELSLAIRRHHAHGGLNVSASHNPPDDNGGKFYNREGGQDVPPDDQALAERVEAITAIRQTGFAQAVAAGKVAFLDATENEHYLAVNRRLSLAPDARGGRIVFTPLHGTGSCTVGRLLRSEGFDVHPVPSQEAFDGAFPAVKFKAPNPEVPSCFEAAEEVGEACAADILMATDPDADRIGLVVRRPEGGWRFVAGNEILFLVTRFVLERRRDAGLLPPDAFVLKTLVTSNLVSTIARSYGCRVVPGLLVGFKYMADLLGQLERTGECGELRAQPGSFVLGVEESHGLLLTPAVRDKDAAGAALALAEMNALAVARGSSLSEELDALYCRFGYIANRLFTTVMTGATGLDRIRSIQASLRDDPPADVAGHKVVAFEDLWDEAGSFGPIRGETDRAARNVLVFTLTGDARLIIRPSGTEPKNKIYVEVPGRTPRADLSLPELEQERQRCDRLVEELGRAFERLTLARVGIDLTPAASRTSSLLGLDHKLHFGTTFLPALERKLRADDGNLDAFVDASLADYGSSARDLVAGGVEAWLETAELPAGSEGRARELFGLGPVSLA